MPDVLYMTKAECEAMHKERYEFSSFKKILLVAALSASVATAGWSITWSIQTSERQARVEERGLRNQEDIRELRAELQRLPGVLVETIRNEFKQRRGNE